jgi:uncharacterized protein
MSSLLLAPIFGALIGLSLGLMGGGGSILTVPILIYILGQDAQTAVATSLAIVGANAVIGTLMHARAGHVQIRQALVFGGVGMLGAYMAAGLAQLVSEAVLMVAFALLMLTIGGMMVRPLPLRNPAEQPENPAWRLIKTILAGGGVGILTGFLGVGGGFLVVPALVLVLGMSMADAVGTSLLVIALNSAAGLAGHLQGGALDWTLIAIFVVTGIAGLSAGTKLSAIWSAQRLRRTFAGMVVTLAVVLLWINVPALFVTA